MSTALKISKNESKRQYWSARVSAWESSGLSQKQFCNDNDLKLSTFQYWQAQLKRPSLKEAGSFIKVTSRNTVTDTVNHQPQIQIRTQHACIGLYSHANPELIKLVLNTMGV